MEARGGGRLVALLLLTQLLPAATKASRSLCFNQSWDECSCDNIPCNNSASCVAECDAKLASPACRATSAQCAQYEPLTCGTWCSDQRSSDFTCSTCRSAECEPFCHGSPSCCKFDLCPVSASRCGDCWSLTCARWGIPRKDTVRALGAADGSITELSITQGLNKWNSVMQEKLGVHCNCADVDGLSTCMEVDLCSAISGLINGTDATVRRLGSTGKFDKRCCAYCDLSSVHGICWGPGEAGGAGPQWGPVNHYSNMINRVARLLPKLEESIEL